MAQRKIKFQTKIGNHAAFADVVREPFNADLPEKELTLTSTITPGSVLDIPSVVLIGGGSKKDRYKAYLKSRGVATFAITHLAELYLYARNTKYVTFVTFHQKHHDAMVEAWMELFVEWLPQIKQLAEPGKHKQHKVEDTEVI